MLDSYPSWWLSDTLLLREGSLCSLNSTHTDETTNKDPYAAMIEKKKTLPEQDGWPCRDWWKILFISSEGFHRAQEKNLKRIKTIMNAFPASYLIRLFIIHSSEWFEQIEQERVSKDLNSSHNMNTLYFNWERPKNVSVTEVKSSVSAKLISNEETVHFLGSSRQKW